MIEALRAAAGRDVSRETYGRLEQYVALLLEANAQQNLIAPKSVPELWNRHILDGAQLLGLAGGDRAWRRPGST
jgi:16S rRNA (guanine527-N7)-methyltransferase